MAKTTKQTRTTRQTKRTAGRTTKTLVVGKTTGTLTEREHTMDLRLRRVFKAPPERVYACFVDADAYAKWIPPHGFTGHVHQMDPKVGGTFRMSFNTINRSWGHTFGGRYLELKPFERIVHTDQFEGNDPMFPSDREMKVTITFTKVKGGTEVNILQEGIPKGPAADGSPQGWGQSLDNLARLCEAELPF